MACEPFDCAECGQRHERCTGHVDKDPETDEPIENRPCRKWPEKGSPTCLSHGGGAPQVRAAAERRLAIEALRKEALALGAPADVDPGEALLDLVREAAGNVEFYRALVAQLPHDEQGIYGRTYHATGKPTGEAKPHVLVVLYNDERDRLNTYAQTALKAGVEERQVRLAESDGRVLMEGVAKGIQAAQLTPEQAEVFRLALVKHIRGRHAEPVGLAGGPA